MSEPFRFGLLSFFLALGQFLFPIVGAAQTFSAGVPMWKEAAGRWQKERGFPYLGPSWRQMEAKKLSPSETTEKPEDPCNSKERAKLAAYRVSLHGGTSSDVIVRAANFCYCRATGNCLFWVFRAANRGYQLLLEADNVQDFGLLRAKSSGYRDLVVWAHDSADRSSARLFQFDGKQYEEVCGWEENYDYRELPDRHWVSAGNPKIVNNRCDPDPSSNPPKF